MLGDGNRKTPHVFLAIHRVVESLSTGQAEPVPRAGHYFKQAKLGAMPTLAVGMRKHNEHAHFATNAPRRCPPKWAWHPLRPPTQFETMNGPEPAPLADSPPWR